MRALIFFFSCNIENNSSTRRHSIKYSKIYSTIVKNPTTYVVKWFPIREIIHFNSTINNAFYSILDTMYLRVITRFSIYLFVRQQLAACDVLHFVHFYTRTLIIDGGAKKMQLIRKKIVKKIQKQQTYTYNLFYPE